MAHPVSHEKHIQELVDEFFTQILTTEQEIDLIWKRLQTDPQASDLKSLQFIAHRTAGSSVMLGFPQIGIAARKLENALREIDPAHPDPQAISSLSMPIQDLHTAILLKGASDPEVVKNMFFSGASLKDGRSSQLIYLVEDDPLQAKDLQLQIGYFGYSVKTFTHLDDLHQALDQTTPTALLLDIVFPEGDLAGIEWAQKLQATHEKSPLIIFISSRDDMAARLQAAQAGCKAYFTKPIDTSALISTLDRLTGQEIPTPYRVMIVDDSNTQATFTALALNKAGMETRIVTEPMSIIHQLNDFNPDLILLDLYMPKCTGIDLARVIRQIEMYVSIPIVFLSAETNRDKQVEALTQGGEDFIAKPIKPDHLIAQVHSRVERYRQLRELMLHDSLTGLLNHTTTKERLLQEIARSQRSGKPVSVAMIDLDNFKRVNDTYGHATGDRVLKSLSWLLRNRLRRTDIIGRYGGEEFAIIFPDTTSEMAVRLLDELRLEFGNIHHQADDVTFSVSFSGGIASYPAFPSASKVSEAADRALYQAKGMNRNLIVVAGPEILNQPA